MTEVYFLEFRISCLSTFWQQYAHYDRLNSTPKSFFICIILIGPLQGLDLTSKVSGLPETLNLDTVGFLSWRATLSMFVAKS